MKRKTLSLSLKQAPVFEAMLSPKHPIIKPVIERFVNGYLKAFNGDAAEIRSICQGAVLKAVKTYSGAKQRKACSCSDPGCSVVARAAVRIMRNDLLNAVGPRSFGSIHARTQKRNNGIADVPLSNVNTEGRDDYDENAEWSPLRGFTLTNAAKDAFSLGNPLQRVIHMQMAEQIRTAPSRLTVPQRAVFRLAVDPNQKVRANARRLEADGVKKPFLVAAQQAVQASDRDVQVVEHTIREILSL